MSEAMAPPQYQQEQEIIVIRPQAGPQEAFLSSPADILIYGGAAGSGKTFGELLEPLHFIQSVKGFGAIIFRRTTPQITSQGGLWDTSSEIYSGIGAISNRTELKWSFPPHGNAIKFAHLEYEKNAYDYQGAQIPLIEFDELTHFCLTPDHDVLTMRGWVPISEVTTQDSVLSKLSGGAAQFRAVLKTYKFRHDDELVQVYQRNGVSFTATKNHRVLIQRQDAKESLGFIEASNLLSTIQNIPRCGRITRGDRGGSVKIPVPKGRGIGRNANITNSIPILDYLEFMGWYLSEGSTFNAAKSRGGSSPCVSIRQTKPNATLAALMGRLPWKVRSDGDNGYRIYSRQLYNHLSPLGDLYQKRIPRWIFETCSAREIEVLLDAFIDGDGHRHNGAANIGLANRGLADDIQEACCLIGWISTRRDAINNKGFEYHAVTISQQSRSVTQSKPENCKLIDYRGDVFCISVDAPQLPDFTRGGYKRPPIHGGNFLIRHNGRVCYTGNSEFQFWYLLSRNRSVCGVRPYVRATCNPDPDSWVAKLIEWWIDPETGYPIPERSGILRWFVRINNVLIWADSPAELEEKYPGIPPKSLTFIPAKLDDNPALTGKDPQYRANLLAMTYVEMMRLLHGNWKVRPKAGDVFKREWFTHVYRPDLFLQQPFPLKIQSWDTAFKIPVKKKSGITTDPDFSVCTTWGMNRQGYFLIDRWKDRVEYPVLLQTAENQFLFHRPHVVLVEDKASGQSLIQSLKQSQYRIPVFPVTPLNDADKRARAESVTPIFRSRLANMPEGAHWLNDYIETMVAFPDDSVHDDDVDSTSMALWYLSVGRLGEGKTVYRINDDYAV